MNFANSDRLNFVESPRSHTWWIIQDQVGNTSVIFDILNAGRPFHQEEDSSALGVDVS